MLFRMLWFPWYPSRQQKLGEHSIKNGGDLEKVDNKILAMASTNTCKH